MTRLLSVVLLACAAAFACSKPDEATIPSDLRKFDQIRSNVNALPASDRDALMRYLVRMKMSGSPADVGVQGITIRQAIELQRGLETQQALREAEASALKEKLQKEFVDRQTALKTAVEVVLIGFQYQPSDIHSRRYRDEVHIRLGFQNKTSRDMAGVQGTAVFRDLFGNEVYRVRVAYQHGVKAEKVATWSGTVEINDFIDRDRRFAQLETSKTKFDFQPDMIVFQDGSSLKAQEQ